MNKIRNHTKELIVLTILLAVAVSVVNAAVFVYYPISITAGWIQPPIRFLGKPYATNAGGTDLGAGNTITVSLSEENTTATLIVHPCRRQRTYYKDILRIFNGDSKAYYIGFNVTQRFGNAISEAELIVRTTGGDLVGTIDLKSTGTKWVPWQLSASSQLRVDLRFTISSGSSGSDGASITLVYSPQNLESPP
jgi:hypothetical protein